MGFSRQEYWNGLPFPSPEDGVEIAKELEVEPENVTELLQSHDKTFSGEDLLLMKKSR